MFFRTEDKNSDAHRDIKEIVESRGFLFEEHLITTKDGYILKLHRVVNPTFNEADKVRKQPVLLQHGFTGCSIHWLIADDDGHLKDPEYDENGERVTSSNLGFALAKHRDVWMGNFRGNRYSLEHKTLSTKDTQFWDFSLDEFIEDDLPSTIDYILRVTGYNKLAYVGHSQGTLTMFGLLASKTEYNDKVKPFIALAPIVRLNHMRSPIRHFFKYVYPITSKITGQAASTSVLKPLIAGHVFDDLLQRISHTALFLMGGFNWSQVLTHRLAVYHSHPFGDVSFKNVNHFLQMYMSGHFCKFNYDDVINHHSVIDICKGIKKEEPKSKNEFLYNSKSPPIYDIKLITNTTICIFHGCNDWFTSDEDLDFIRNELKVDLLEDYRVPHDEWNHLDFIFGKDCGYFVNSKVIDLIKQITDDVN